MQKKKLNGSETNFKGLNDKLNQMLREQSVEQQNTNKFKNDNHKLKQEIDVAKDNLEQSEKKKSRKITDDMKSKLERTEIEQEMNIKKNFRRKKSIKEEK